MTLTLTPTPTAPFSTKISLLGRMLAACTSFRTRSGLDAGDTDAETKLLSEESTQRRIFYPRKDLKDVELWPIAVIVPEFRRYAAMADGADTSLVHDRGILGLLIADDATRYPDDIEQSARDFENFWGAVVSQLADQSGEDWTALETYSRLRIACIEEESPPQLSPIEEQRQHWLATAFIYYGRWPEREVLY